MPASAMLDRFEKGLRDQNRQLSFDDWMNRFEMHSVQKKRSDLLKTYQLPTFLRGQSLSVYNSIHPEVQQSWSKVKKDMRCRFRPADNTKSFIEQHSDAKQVANERVTNYYTRLSRLTKDAFHWVALKSHEFSLEYGFCSSVRPYLATKFEIRGKQTKN